MRGLVEENGGIPALDSQHARHINEPNLELPAPVKPSDDFRLMASAKPEETPSQRIGFSCFKPLSFRVLSYTAIGTIYNRKTSNTYK